MSKKGYKMSESHKSNLAKAHVGIRHSLETIEKIRLKKIGQMVGNKNPAWKGGKPNCFDCGEKLSRRRVKDFTKRCRVCSSKRMVGSLSPNWRGGATPKNQIIRTSKEYKLWRVAVFTRDNYTCIWCGVKCGNGKKVFLNADHIKPFALFPELRFAIDNGRTLCVDCHRKTDTFGGRVWSPSQ